MFVSLFPLKLELYHIKKKAGILRSIKSKNTSHKKRSISLEILPTIIVFACFPFLIDKIDEQSLAVLRYMKVTQFDCMSESFSKLRDYNCHSRFFVILILCDIKKFSMRFCKVLEYIFIAGNLHRELVIVISFMLYYFLKCTH